MRKRSRREDSWEHDDAIYNENQIAALLNHCGVEVDGETHTHFLVFCPFHGNDNSPAMAVDKNKGLFSCFNPSCDAAGKIETLIMKRMKVNLFQALRLIAKYRNHGAVPIETRLSKVLTKQGDLPLFPQEVLDRAKRDFDGPGREYMRSRHFEDETLDYFDIGFSAKQGMVIVPMHDIKGRPIGLIGRSIENKRFKNSTNLPKSLTLWNIHRAKKCGDTVIVVEASFDAMRIHQAGFPNVVAILGGHITDAHVEQLGKTFSTIIIMTDCDDKIYKPNCRACGYDSRCEGHRPGRDLGRAIVNKFPNKKILWASMSNDEIFPREPLEGFRTKHAKDAGDMTDDEIRRCIKNASSNFNYSYYNMEETLP